MHTKGPLAQKNSINTEDPGEPRQKAANLSWFRAMTCSGIETKEREAPFDSHDTHRAKLKAACTNYGWHQRDEEREKKKQCLSASWTAPGWPQKEIAKTGNCRTRNTQPLVRVPLE